MGNLIFTYGQWRRALKRSRIARVSSNGKDNKDKEPSDESFDCHGLTQSNKVTGHSYTETISATQI